MRVRDLQVGDLVLRKTMGTAINPREGKLGPNWEGPYTITAVSSTGACSLENADGFTIPNTWNVHHLRKYYH